MNLFCYVVVVVKERVAEVKTLTGNRKFDFQQDVLVCSINATVCRKILGIDDTTCLIYRIKSLTLVNYTLGEVMENEGYKAKLAECNKA